MSYTVRKGDDFDLISRIVYGTDSKVQLLRDANPGVSEPLTSGIILLTPDIDIPTVIINSEDTDNTAQVFINGEKFKFWSAITIERRVDGFSQASFVVPFDEDYKDFRKTFRPLSFAQIIIAIDLDFVYFGYMTMPLPTMEDDIKSVTVSSYSRAAVMSNCTFPIGTNSFEVNEVKLDTIASRLCESIALTAKFDDDVGPVFKKVTVKPDDIAADFLIKLANQRGLLLGDDDNGDPVFRKSVAPGNPVAKFIQGQSPMFTIVPSFNAEQYFSHITAISPTGVAFTGAAHTAENTKFKNVIKPFTFQASELESADLPAAVRAKAGRMFADAVSYELSVDTWRDPQGDLWKDNTTITVEAPGVMIYTQFEFTIRKVLFQKTEISEVATLSIILPESLRGELPTELPWEE